MIYAMGRGMEGSGGDENGPLVSFLFFFFDTNYYI